MSHFYESIQQVITDFKNNNIDSSTIGFYDDPNFLKIEQKKPEYLNNYARYVQDKEYSEEYLNKTRQVIPIIAEKLQKELIRDGRQGACIDLSMLLSKILEKEGIWNYIVKGSLTISFPEKSGIEKQFFWAIDQGDFAAGHSWVVAPPFKVIDLAIKQQGSNFNQLEYIPELIISESIETEIAQVEDIVSPLVRQYFQSQGVNSKDILPIVNPILKKVLSTFKPVNVEFKNTTFKYITVAIAAPDCPLEEMVGISSEGMSAIKIYKDLVKPYLL